MTAVVVQARIDSSRLPGKSLLPLGRRPLISAVMAALREVPADVRVLACPEDSAGDFLLLAEDAEFEIVAGSKEDVLSRFCDVIRRFSPDRIIRATGDNPFVFADAAAEIHREALARGAHYGGYLELPYGAGVESVSSEALLRAEREADLPGEREHVCPYLYNHPELFSVYRPPAPARWNSPGIRLTVDTLADYEQAAVLDGALTGLYGESGKARFRGSSIIAAYRESCGGPSVDACKKMEPINE
ncbi:cytidylyltransferase domain-containing protein [Breznakiella homolactica]|uniref:Spore coat protein n=1 Tax=Breznakiella homolactica TaxID=2798577 RepID=A0A7T7XLC3_9SPIR|nr:spore coat protein [Breznakiella homolactica]QQO08410.1 spore coat protein [Breznakiella homolactica]